MKILVSAYMCSPFKGSEAGVSWGFINALAQSHSLCVITDIAFREDIERWLNEHPGQMEQVRFEYLLRYRSLFYERIWPPAYYHTYKRWQREALDLARKLHAEIGFDLAHQLTLIGFREPGYLWKLGIPFVWGPVGGMGLFPWRFLTKVGFYGAVYYFMYNLFNLAHMRFLSRPKIAAKVAGRGLITANTENRDGAFAYWGANSTVLCPVGPPHNPDDQSQGQPKSGGHLPPDVGRRRAGRQ